MTSPTTASPPGNRPAIVTNIIAGTRLGIFLPVRREDFRFSVDQAVVLVLIGLASDAAYKFVSADPDSPFDTNEIGYLSVSSLIFIFSVYLLARMQNMLSEIVPLIVVLMSPQFVLLLGSAMSNTYNTYAFENYNSYTRTGGIVFGVVLMIWVFGISFRCLRIVLAPSRWRTVLLLIVYFLILMVPELSLKLLPSWYRVRHGAPQSSVADTGSFAATVFQSQVGLLTEATRSLEPQRSGIPDLYFVGFGSYANQDVFWNEVRAVKTLFDERFDTQDRSIVLVNNPETLQTHPLASVDNLRFVLSQVAERMDMEEDILFLFLTSHGSKNHELTVQFPSLGLVDLPAMELDEILDEFRFKWRVIVVSACYSGGFIDALEDDYSLIMTASDADRKSFGCRHQRDFTYFGESYFDDQLREKYSFIEAFAGARAAIAKREQDEGLTPSLPRIHIGRSIEAVLEALEQRLRALD